MTYQAHSHPRYVEVRQRVASSPSTFVLLPSLDVEACVSEVVRRQVGRRFARTPHHEEQVIREWLLYYRARQLIRSAMMFAIKAEVNDPWAPTFVFSAQKTMYGQTPRVTITISRTARAKRRLGRTELKRFCEIAAFLRRLF